MIRHPLIPSRMPENVTLLNVLPVEHLYLRQNVDFSTFERLTKLTAPLAFVKNTNKVRNWTVPKSRIVLILPILILVKLVYSTKIVYPTLPA